MSIALSFLLLAAAPAPAPIVVSPQLDSSPPMMTVQRNPVTDRYRVPPAMREQSAVATVAVDIKAGKETLWSGTMRTARSAVASVNRSFSEAASLSCAPDARNNQRSVRNSFSFSLNVQNYGDGDPGYNFNINWERPGENCSDAVSQRTVQLSSSLRLAVGQTITIQGDAGLVAQFRLVGIEQPKQ